MGLLGLIGLFLAAGAHDQTMYVVGLILFGFGILYNFWLIKRWFDRAEGHGP